MNKKDSFTILTMMLFIVLFFAILFGAPFYILIATACLHEILPNWFIVINMIIFSLDIVALIIAFFIGKKALQNNKEEKTQ